MNNLLIILTVVLYYSGVLFAFKKWGKVGLYAWIVIGTVFANLEVNKLVDIFGFEMTLGNVLFSSTFLVTDIMSECFGKEESKKCVQLGVFASICMIVMTNIALLFKPSANDIMQESMQTLFGTVPRICAASLFTYILVQIWDIFAYHKIWDITTKKFKNKERFLWLRNNGSTILSQLINSVLFNALAFGGVYDNSTLISIIVCSFVFCLILALLDTPFMYLARIINKDNKKTSHK